MTQAWYEYPRIDNFGVFPDPVGPYPKPDSNFVGIPDGTIITAPAAGMITMSRPQPWGDQAYSITVRMDTPWNDVATHYAINYCNDPMNFIGVHVDFGTPLCKSGNPYGIGLAFAFTDASIYGEATQNEPFQGRYINPKLNPVSFLDKLKASHNDPSTIGKISGTSIVQDSSSNPLQGLASLGTFFSGVNTFLSDPTRLIKILAGSVMVIAGVVLLVKQFVPASTLIKAVAA